MKVCLIPLTLEFKSLESSLDIHGLSLNVINFLDLSGDEIVYVDFVVINCFLVLAGRGLCQFVDQITAGTQDIGVIRVLECTPRVLCEGIDLAGKRNNIGIRDVLERLAVSFDLD